jgi:hypothetical protein
MGKPTYLVYVVHRGREDDYRRYRQLGNAANAWGDVLTEDTLGFMESVRASNRREASVLVRARYPDHHVTDKAIKA